MTTRSEATLAERPLDRMVGRQYATVVADPPWEYKTPGQIGKTLEHRPNRDNGLSKHGAGSVARYGAMSMQELMALRVADVVADDAHLYLWTTNGFMEQAYSLARAWGFEPKTIITWTKTRQADGKPSMKMGYYYRGATEHCLFCVRGSLRLRGPAHATAILEPRTPHSVKPDYFYSMVEQQSPGAYLELFARRKRKGWDVFGDEIKSDVILTPNKAYTDEMAALYENIKPVLPPTAKRILDIGAGLVGIDAFLGNHYPCAEIHLLDKDGVSQSKPLVGWNESAAAFGHYSSFNDARKVLASAGIQQERVVCWENFPVQVNFNLVVSFLSWGFHYPVGTYLNRVLSRLAPGGVLIMDFRKEAKEQWEVIEAFGEKNSIVLAEGEKWQRIAFINWLAE